MEIAIYARVSTQDQNAIQMQIEHCQNIARSRNHFGAKQRSQRDVLIL